MSNVILAKYFDRIKAAYEVSAFTEGICPEMEERIIQFEANHKLDFDKKCYKDINRRVFENLEEYA